MNIKKSNEILISPDVHTSFSFDTIMKKLIFSIVHWKQELKKYYYQYSKNENNLYHYIIL